MKETETKSEVVECKNCKGPMKWDSYLLVNRPDILRGRDKRAPIDWAWHCRCGYWKYDKRGPSR